MYISLRENYRGHPDNVSFMQFSTKIDGFEQKDSQSFENSYNSYQQYPLEKFFIFTIYQNYTLALIANLATTTSSIHFESRVWQSTYDHDHNLNSSIQTWKFVNNEVTLKRTNATTRCVN